MSKANQNNYPGNTKAARESQNIFREAAGLILSVYILIMLVIFPLYFRDYYYDILEARFEFFWHGTTVMLALMALTGLAFVISDFTKASGRTVKAFLAGLKPSRLIKTLSGFDIAFTILMLIYLVSMALSGYPYETWWGNQGRYQGVFLWLLFYADYILISRLYQSRAWHIKAFEITGSLICAWGMTDYFKMNLMHFFDDVPNKEINMIRFTSSIGNINSYTAMTAIILAIATVLFITERGRIATAINVITMILGNFGCMMGLSDNAMLAYAALFGFMPFVFWRRRDWIQRYAVAAATALTAMKISGYLMISDIPTTADDAYYSSAMLKIGSLSITTVIVILIWIVLCIILFKEYHRNHREDGSTQARFIEESIDISANTTDRKAYRIARRIWAGILILGVIGVILAFIDCNSGRHPEFWTPYKNIFYFDDDWGTGRGLNWKLAMQFFLTKADLRMKLFGYGPDTYYMITMDNFFQKMADSYYGMFDSAHNEYLQYLLTIGITGLAAYIAYLVTCIRTLLHKRAQRTGADAYAYAAGFMVIAYAAQALINIAVPLVTPVFMLLTFIGLNICRQNDARES